MSFEISFAHKLQIGVTRAYYLAYPIGLIVSFVVFWISNLIKRPQIMLSGWHEPKNYFRPEEDPELNNVLYGTEVERSDDENGSAEVPAKDGEKVAMSNIEEKSS